MTGCNVQLLPVWVVAQRRIGTEKKKKEIKPTHQQFQDHNVFLWGKIVLSYLYNQHRVEKKKSIQMKAFVNMVACVDGSAGVHQMKTRFGNHCFKWLIQRAEQCLQIFLMFLSSINEWAGSLLLMLKDPTTVDSPNRLLPGTERCVSPCILFAIPLYYRSFCSRQRAQSPLTSRHILFFIFCEVTCENQQLRSPK